MYRHLAALLVAAFVFAAAAPASAVIIGKDKTLGGGFGGGTMTSGLSGKMYLSESTAVQGVVGVTGWGLSVGVDYVMDFGEFMNKPFGRLFWGFGAGAGAIMYSVGANSATIIGLSGIFQVGWHFKKFPLEIVADIRPTYFIGQYIGGLNLGAVGGAVRWYF